MSYPRKRFPTRAKLSGASLTMKWYRPFTALFRMAQAYAAVQGRGYVIPDDIKALAHPVIEHRLILNPESRIRRVTARGLLADLIAEVKVPAGEWKAGGRQGNEVSSL